MIELRVVQDRETGSYRAGLGIIRAVDEPSYPRLNHGTGAHRARLNGDICHGVAKAVVADTSRSGAKGYNLRVGGGVAVRNRAIAGARNYAVVNDHDSANGDLPALAGPSGLVERRLHEMQV
jgi:hypothetical protein